MVGRRRSRGQASRAASADASRVAAVTRGSWAGRRRRSREQSSHDSSASFGQARRRRSRDGASRAQVPASDLEQLRKSLTRPSAAVASSSVILPTLRRAPSSRSAAATRSRFSRSCSARSRRRRCDARLRRLARRGHRRGGTRPGARRGRRGSDPDRSRQRQPARPAARSALICAMNARTFSGVSSRRPSRVIGTSSAVGARSPASSCALSQRPTTSSITTPSVRPLPCARAR